MTFERPLRRSVNLHVGSIDSRCSCRSKRSRRSIRGTLHIICRAGDCPDRNQIAHPRQQIRRRLRRVGWSVRVDATVKTRTWRSA
jgi:hypothetical protein